MIAYFTHNKGKTKFCEDSLTASVFGTLQYLPVDIFLHILKKSLLHDQLPSYIGGLNKVIFWENWSAEGTDNTSHIQPDVLMRFEACDVLLEAKRHDENQQSAVQMHDQITAYFTTYGEENKPLYFIQVGGLHSLSNELDNNKNGKTVPICKTNWSRLLNEVVEAQKKLSLEKTSQSSASSRILEDVIKAFSLHQYYKLAWLGNLSKTKINNFSMDKLFRYE